MSHVKAIGLPLQAELFAQRAVGADFEELINAAVFIVSPGDGFSSPTQTAKSLRGDEALLVKEDAQ